MLERFNPALKMVCMALAALVLYQFARLAMRKGPMEELSFSATTSLLATPAVQPEVQSAKKQTNAPPQDSGKNETNSLALPPSGKRATSPVTRREATRKPAADLPPAVQARVERITQSEIFGVVVRPLPMALLGIAGNDAFLRAPNGQTGLLKEGEELGGIKLLRIGTNRVLIEHEQQEKELTVFSGFGSETLLPKTKGKANP